MKKIISSFLILSVFAVIFVSCNSNTESSKKANSQSTEKIGQSDALPSWNEGKIKTNIIEFVEATTNKNSGDFIPVKDRIAVFDNDGTMWSEQPFYFQYYFSLHLLNKYSAKHPEWNDDEDLNLLLKEGDKAFLKVGHKGLAKLLFATNTGQSVEEFKSDAKQWAETAKNPSKNVLFTDLAFQPMLELLSYLKGNGFKNYIVSGGTSEFMRAFICEKYGIPEQNILGSYFKSKYNYNNGNALVQRQAEFLWYNDKGAKVELIQQIIGKKPIFCGGNSDGDLAMMQWTASNSYKNFQLYVHHTDSVREWAYDRGSPIGEFNLGLDEALEKGWSIMDMKNDWKTIFSEK